MKKMQTKKTKKGDGTPTLKDKKERKKSRSKQKKIVEK